mgnify:FL=1
MHLIIDVGHIEVKLILYLYDFATIKVDEISKYVLKICR